MAQPAHADRPALVTGYSGLDYWARAGLRRAFWLAVAVGAVVVQAACGGWLEWRGARPDLVLAAVVAAGVLGGWRVGAIVGGLAGWCTAALTPPPLWLWPLLYGVTGALAGAASQPFHRENLWLYLVLVGISAGVLGGILCLVSVNERAWRQALGWWWLSGWYSTAAALAVFLLIRRLRRRLP